MNKILTYTLITLTILSFGGMAISGLQAQGVTEEGREYFNENRGERMFERLAEAGLTEEQIQALRVQKEELREEHGCLSNLSFEERQARAEEMRAEMNEFAEQNGIDLSVLGGFGGVLKRGLHKGSRKGFGKTF